MTEAEFGRWLDQHTRMITFIALRYCPDLPGYDSSDVIQELILAILENWRDYDSSRASFTTYAYMKMQSRAHQLCRSVLPEKERCCSLEAEQRSLPPQVSGLDAETMTLQREDVRLVLDCILSRPLPQQATILMALSGYRQEDIAHAMGIAQPRVSQILRSFRTALRRLLFP